MASRKNGALYVGVTSNLVGRIWKHKNQVVDGHTEKYNIKLLVYFEQHLTMDEAILREKRIKKWKRQWKINLIEERNPDWLDLWEEING